MTPGEEGKGLLRAAAVVLAILGVSSFAFAIFLVVVTQPLEQSNASWWLIHILAVTLVAGSIGCLKLARTFWLEAVDI